MIQGEGAGQRTAPSPWIMTGPVMAITGKGRSHASS